MIPTIHPDTLDFFNELMVNNNRDWFQENKPRWESIRTQFEHFTQALIDFLSPIDPTIKDLVAKKCIYRIYRDVRFSSDKRPYKTHIACFLPTKGIRNYGVPGYYLQIGQEDYGLHGNCSLGGGIFMPSPEALNAIRQEIFYNIEEFKAIMAEPSYQHYFGSDFYTIKKLTRAPKGYPNDWPDVDLLKYKDYTTMYELPDKIFNSEHFFDDVCQAFSASVPLNKFIQKAMYNLI